VTNEVVKGFQDFSGEEAEKREEIRKILVGAFEKYGFEPAETPIIEYEEFVRGQNQEDEAVSDIFKLEDKGKRKLALRYEFTFQLKRIANNKKLPYKRYQIGYVFRDEPVSSNRVRQITQCDVDIVGSSIKDDAEVLALASGILKELGVKATICINNRKLLNEILEEQGVKAKDKEQVIREIDKFECVCKFNEKDIAENLKKIGAGKVLNIIKKPESYFKKYSAYKEIEELKKYCKLYGIKVNFSPSLARGLAYYNGSVFEIKIKDMKESICGGGSYLVDEIQSTGISFGLERLSQLANIKTEKEKYLVVSLGKDKETIKLAGKLRKQGKNVIVYYGKPSKALEYANAKSINKVIFVGEEEVKRGKFKVKDMGTGKESLMQN